MIPYSKEAVCKPGPTCPSKNQVEGRTSCFVQKKLRTNAIYCIYLNISFVFRMESTQMLEQRIQSLRDVLEATGIERSFDEIASVLENVGYSEDRALDELLLESGYKQGEALLHNHIDMTPQFHLSDEIECEVSVPEEAPDAPHFFLDAFTPFFISSLKVEMAPEYYESKRDCKCLVCRFLYEIDEVALPVIQLWEDAYMEVLQFSGCGMSQEEELLLLVLAKAITFLDFTEDESITLANIICSLHTGTSVETTKANPIEIEQSVASRLKSGSSKEEITDNAIAKALQNDLDTKFIAEKSDRHEQRMKEEIASVEEVAFQQVRLEFPTEEDLGIFDSDCFFLSDEDIRVALTAFEFKIKEAIKYLKGVLVTLQGQNAIEKRKYLEQERSVFSARNELVREQKGSSSVVSRAAAPMVVPSYKYEPHTEDMSAYDGNTLASKDKTVLLAALTTLQHNPINVDSGLMVDADDRLRLRFLGFKQPPVKGKDAFDGENITPKGARNVYRIDLHHVHVKEALQLVRSIVAFVYKSSARQKALITTTTTPLDTNAAFGLLVGKGLHSEGGQSRLGPNITRDLSANNIPHDRIGAWIVIYPKKGH